MNPRLAQKSIRSPVATALYRRTTMNSRTDSHTLIGDVGSGKKRRTWLFSNKDYSDFRLRFEFRMDPETESGIALRTIPVFNIQKDGRIAILLTNNPKEPIPNGTIVTWGGGVAHPQFTPKSAVALRANKAWNTAEIEFRGSHILAAINGQTIHDVQLDQPPGTDKPIAGFLQKSGRLALDCHTGRVEFRKIEIQESN